MQVFQLGDQLGFCFKTADKIWLVGEFRQYDLDCDLSIDDMLSGKIDCTISPFPDGFKKIIAFYSAGSV